MIDVAEIVNDPDVAQPFTILRSTGNWLNGVWQSVTSPVSAYGVIADPSDTELDMMPEGDIVKGGKLFWSSTPMFNTNATEGQGGSSDILLWRGLEYRVLAVKQFQDYGYYRAFAVRMKAS